MDSIATESTEPMHVPYAAHATSHGHRVLAGAAVLLGGLALIVLGGCFLIGVMLTSNHGFNTAAASVPLNTSSIILICILYVLAAICFCSAALVILAGLRGLFRVLRG